MPKFSIIVPVYNVEEYIDDCLKSIFNQSFKDFEVIVVNDGTKDNSMDIVKNYDVKVINQENAGLSDARNTGVKSSTGEYLLFIDSDDYIEKDLLKNINNNLKDNPDVLRFQIKEIFDDNRMVNHEENSFDTTNGVEAFTKICNYHFIENAWSYVIKRKYYLDNKFEFKKGTYHEDYGLMPLVIIKANKVKSISYIGYYYRQRSNSIMSSTDYNKTKKKVDDFYNHYLYLNKEINKTKLDNKIFKSYISNSLLIKICELNNKDYKIYKSKVKEDKVIDNLLDDSLIRKIKKILFKISPKLTIKFLK